MKFGKTAKALAIAVAVGMSSQVMAASTNLWWSMNFADAATITALTNAGYSAVGQWTRAAGDESSMTNTIINNATQALKLDTQGTDLTWTPNTASTSTVVLVDADIYLVGSDSAPTGFDGDVGKPVQTAVYLKNYLNAASVTTNSVLCAYIGVTESSNTWVELQGSMIDTNWYNLRIEVDYSDLVPVAKFIVNSMVKQDSAAKSSFEIANYKKFNTEGLKKVNSVSFRGTGAVDNFAGNQVVPTPAVLLNFTVKTVTDNLDDVSFNGSVDPGTSVTPGTSLTISFNETDAATSMKYLTVVRVYTNEAATLYVDYNATYVGPGWSLDSPLVDGDFVVDLTIDTTGMTYGYTIKAYYGAEPTAEPTNPDPVVPPAAGGAISGDATKFEMLGVGPQEYFSVTFLAPEAGIQYTLCTSATLVAPASFVASGDALATAKSGSIGQQITLSAPTGGAPTMFYVIKASTVVPPPL